MMYSNEAFQIHARLNTLEFIFQNVVLSFYDKLPKEVAYEKLSSIKDTILGEINKMKFPNSAPADGDSMRKEMLKLARELIGGMQDRYKPDT